MKKNIYIFLMIFIIFSIGMEVFAMSSTKYRIDTDSINFGGTDNSSSSQFFLSDTYGEIGSGVSSSSRYAISSGYRMLQSSYISISTVADITMPSMSGLTPGQSSYSAFWVVKTDNAAGYMLEVRSTTAPSLKSDEGASFSDYAPVSSSTSDYTFIIAASNSSFAFTPEGVDISQKYLDNGSDCGIGNSDTADRCWDGFSTIDKIIAYRTSSNHPDGTVTTIKYRTAIGSNKIQDAGTYTSTQVLTAVVL
jgi:hypothetical protein